MKNWNLKGLTIGVCYYPEHWPKDMWEDDLKRMKKMGISFVRVAEFAWAVMEPQEDVFDFSLFDEFIALCENMSMPVIMGTPTATPPVWLTTKYPEVLNKDKQGVSFHPGHRRHYNMNTDIYYELSKRIISKMAERYGNSPVVIGWQLDNEFNCTVNEYYSDADQAAFRRYCKQKYGSLDKFNDCMGNTFWSQIYTDWEQIRLPSHVPGNAFNPHMILEAKKFISHTVNRYAKMQSDVLRSYIPQDRFITTNGSFKNIDYTQMMDESLDFFTFDSYPNFVYDLNNEYDASNDLLDRRWGINLSNVRAISKSFGIMEQQSASHGWSTSKGATMPKPGQVRLWSYQSMAHGADFVAYFRWRTAPYGSEIYWQGLNDHSNRFNRTQQEVSLVAKEFAKLKAMHGSQYYAKVGFLMDYNNEFDAEVDNVRRQYHLNSERSWFKASQFTHTPMDFVYITDKLMPEELKQYDLLVYTHPLILTQNTADLLKQYVRAGGKLILGSRTGTKDEYGRCPITTCPGFLKDIAGVESEEYTGIGPYDEQVDMLWNDEPIEMPSGNEILNPIKKDVQILATFANSYYAGKPALTKRKHGRGWVYMHGGAFSERSAVKLLQECNVISPYAHLFTIPKSCELAVRRRARTNYYTFLNYSSEEKQITLHKAMNNLLTGEKLSTCLILPPYGVAVLK